MLVNPFWMPYNLYLKWMVLSRVAQMVCAIRPPLSDLRHEIRRVVSEIGAHAVQLDRLDDGLAREACRGRLGAVFARLEDLQAELPDLPRTFADLALLAEVALNWAEKGPDDAMVALDPDRANPDQHFAARLIRGVLAMAGPMQRADVPGEDCACTADEHRRPRSTTDRPSA